MNIRSKQHLLGAVLALGITVALAAPVLAQNRSYDHTGNTSATLQVSFGTAPHWSNVRGTKVREVRQGERQDYDLFRYGSSYYAYQNNRWYSSRRGNGQYTAIEDRAVPREISKVPSSHWRNYPSGWTDKSQSDRNDSHGKRNN